MLAPISMMSGTPARHQLDVCTREVGRVQQAFRRPLGAHQRANGGLGDGIRSREIAAGAEPAHRNGKAATSTGGLAHDVSILIGVGRQLGSQPRAKVSMTIMRAPQRGHRRGSTRGLSGATSGWLLGIGGRRGDIEECAGRHDALGAIGGGKELVVADAVEARWQDMHGSGG
jgi:hypothetical protein